MLIASISVLGIMIFWLITLSCVKSDNPPALRFFQLSKITFVSPSIGSLLGVVPMLGVVGVLKLF